MKAIYFNMAGALALTFGFAGFTPMSVQGQTLAQIEAEPYYLDQPQTPGTWSYEDEPGEKLALFGDDPREPVFLLRCASGTFAIARVTDGSQSENRAMRIVTETTTRQLEASPVPERNRILAASIDPRDPLLDAMAITKGRIAVEVEGMPALYVPAWVEITRVIEDCR
ncbi:MAG: hypothetical protein AAGE86_13595 [Pseudomonadota bacterium]